jgi:universal stress protein E
MCGMLENILVLVRGADPAQPAVQRAVLLAGRTTRLMLFDLVHEPMLDGYLGNSAIYESLRTRVVAERAEDLQRLVADLQGRGLTVEGEAVWGHPMDEAATKEALARHADLVVIAPGPESPGLTHNEWRLVSTCPAAVLVVKARAQTNYRHIVAAVDPFHAHSKPGELDLAILSHADELRTRTRAMLTALHCFVPFEYFGSDLTQPVSAPFGDDARRAELAKVLHQAGLQASIARVETGPTPEVIKALLDRGEVDVVVMGVLARGRVKEWLVGSTAERVLQGVPVDVLAVKSSIRQEK